MLLFNLKIRHMMKKNSYYFLLPYLNYFFKSSLLEFYIHLIIFLNLIFLIIKFNIEINKSNNI